MINNPVYNDELVRGNDLQYVVDAINNNELYGDQVSTKIDKGTGGTTISVIQQDAVAVGSGGSTSTYLAKIKTYTEGTGVYTVDIYNNGYNEDATETDIKATPTITTFTPLGIGEKAIVMKDEVETLGDDES